MLICLNPYETHPAIVQSHGAKKNSWNWWSPRPMTSLGWVVWCKGARPRSCFSHQNEAHLPWTGAGTWISGRRRVSRQLQSALPSWLCKVALEGELRATDTPWLQASRVTLPSGRRGLNRRKIMFQASNSFWLGSLSNGWSNCILKNLGSRCPWSSSSLNISNQAPSCQYIMVTRPLVPNVKGTGRWGCSISFRPKQQINIFLVAAQLNWIVLICSFFRQSAVLVESPPKCKKKYFNHLVRTAFSGTNLNRFRPAQHDVT